MSGLHPDDPKYVIARGLKAVEDFKLRQVAERAAAIIRAEQKPIKSDSLAQRLADELQAMYELGRPRAKLKYVAKQLRERPGAGEFSQRTFEEAVKLAWPKGKAR